MTTTSDEQIVEQTLDRPSIMAPLLSALIPGAGDLWLSRRASPVRTRGFCFLGLTVVFLLAFTVGGLNHFYWAFWLARCWFGLNVASAILTCKSAYGRLCSWKLSILFLAVAVFLGQGIQVSCAYLFGIRDYEVPGTASEPTIRKGENVWADNSILMRKKLRPGDLVTLKYRGVYYVKRLVAFGGDEVLAFDGRLQVNGKPLKVPFVQTGEESDQAPRNFGPIRVPLGKIFVIGDNRDISLDSRGSEFGFPPETSLRGKVFFVRKSPDSERNGTPVY